MFVGGFEKFAYQLFDRFPMHTIREKDKLKMQVVITERKLLAVGFACGLEYMQHLNSLL